MGSVVFREGDTVMQMKNNYDIEWEQGENTGTRNFQWRNGNNNKYQYNIRNNRSRL